MSLNCIKKAIIFFELYFSKSLWSKIEIKNCSGRLKVTIKIMDSMLNNQFILVFFYELKCLVFF